MLQGRSTEKSTELIIRVKRLQRKNWHVQNVAGSSTRPELRTCPSNKDYDNKVYRHLGQAQPSHIAKPKILYLFIGALKEPTFSLCPSTSVTYSFPFSLISFKNSSHSSGVTSSTSSTGIDDGLTKNFKAVLVKARRRRSTSILGMLIIWKDRE